MLHFLQVRKSNARLFTGHMISRNMCYDVRKVDIMAGKQTFMYDTHAVIQALESQGEFDEWFHIKLCKQYMNTCYKY